MSRRGHCVGQFKGHLSWHIPTRVCTAHAMYTVCFSYAFNLCKVQSMDDNCGEWVECMGVASGCGEQEVGVASGSGWNLWVWLAGGECV